MQAAEPALEVYLPILASLIVPLAIGLATYFTLMRRNALVFWAAFGFGILGVVLAAALQLPLLPILKDEEALRGSLAIVVSVTSLIEELVKFGGAWIALMLFRNRFEGAPLLAAGTFVTVALSFAVVENLFYVAGVTLTKPELAWTVAFARAFATMPMHATAGLVMGYFGARWFVERRASVPVVLATLFLPYFLHVAFNLLVVLSVPQKLVLDDVRAYVEPVSTAAGAAATYLLAALTIWALWRRYRTRAA